MQNDNKGDLIMHASALRISAEKVISAVNLRMPDDTEWRYLKQVVADCEKFAAELRPKLDRFLLEHSVNAKR